MKNPKIKIDLTMEDLEELMAGGVFNWTYTTDKGQDIDIMLFNDEVDD